MAESKNYSIRLNDKNNKKIQDLKNHTNASINTIINSFLSLYNIHL